MKKLPKYLIRPGDGQIFELDETNNLYSSLSTKGMKNRQPPYPHFNYENLTGIFKFFPIQESELKTYMEMFLINIEYSNDEY